MYGKNSEIQLWLSNNFAHNLKTLRLEKDLTRRSLARLIMSRKARIAYLEENSGTPTLAEVYAVSEYFDISIDDLLTCKLILGKVDLK